MARRTEGNKLSYEGFWTLAMVHIGTYPCMNISQQLTLPVHPVSVAEIHCYRYLESHRGTQSGALLY